MSLESPKDSESSASPIVTEVSSFTQDLPVMTSQPTEEFRQHEQFPFNHDPYEGKNTSEIEQSASPRVYGQSDYSKEYPRTVQNPNGGMYYVDITGRDVEGKAIEESLRNYVPQTNHGVDRNNNSSHHSYHPQMNQSQPQSNHSGPNHFQQPQSQPRHHQHHYQHQQTRQHYQHQQYSQHDHKQGQSRGGNRLSTRGAPPVSSYTKSTELMLSSKFPFIYIVNFKRTKDQFIHSTSYPLPFQIGDFVKVEADRGHDIGIISEIVLLPPHIKGHMSIAEVEAELRIPIPQRYVFMHASENEIQFLLEKVRDESRALQVCRELAHQRQMKLNLLDAEFQFDKNKLTFIFTSDRHIDFRELVRDLFAIFKTRIWMHKINPYQASMFMDEFAQSEPFQGAIPTRSVYAAKGSMESMSQHAISSSRLPPPILEAHQEQQHQPYDQYHHNDQYPQQREFEVRSHLEATSYDTLQETYLSSQQHEALLKKYLPPKNASNV